MSITMERRFQVDLSRPAAMQTLPDQLTVGDRAAHTITAVLTRGGQPLECIGSVTGYCRRPDGVTVVMPGQARGCEASVTLTEDCYRVPGWCTLYLRAAADEALATVLAVQLLVTGEPAGTLIDPEQIVPSLDDVIAMMATMAEQTDAARAAARRAEEILGSLPGFRPDAQGNIVISLNG